MGSLDIFLPPPSPGDHHPVPARGPCRPTSTSAMSDVCEVGAAVLEARDG
jgi:hypothetical protein